MKHSDIHAGSGTVVSINDPATGMYLDLAFEPGQTHRVLHVMLNGKLRSAYTRLIKVDSDGPDDLVVSFRAPSAPSDAPATNKNPKPHPATVLHPGNETRAGREALRAEGQKKAADQATGDKHPATVLKPEEATRAAMEALQIGRAHV